MSGVSDFAQNKFVMAGLDPATQSPRGSAAEKTLNRSHGTVHNESFTRTSVRVLGGRVKPGHDEI